MATVTVCGYSGDCIEIEGAIREEWYLSGTDVDYLAFSDGTVLSIQDDPDGSGCWRISRRKVGSAEYTHIPATENGDDSDDYTDKVTLAGDIVWVVHGDGLAS